MPEFAPLPPIAAEPVSVVLLADNDAAHLENVVADWAAYLNGLDRDYEILLVDDGSADGTAKRSAALADRHRRLKTLRHPARQGEGAALRTGLAAARHPLVFYTRCEPRYRPADFKKLLAEIDKVHLISGYRAGRPVPRFWRLVGSAWRLFTRVVLSCDTPPLPGWLGWRRHAGRSLARVVFALRNQDISCPFRLLRRSILARLPVQSDGAFAHVELLAKANFAGCLLGEEVPLGDRNRPVVPETRPGDGFGRIFREASRLFRHPDFGPPRVAGVGKAGA